MVDKYGAGDDPYCYPGSDVLINKLDIKEDEQLAEAEKVLSDLSLDDIEFSPPPYNLDYFQKIHFQLFSDIYEWAGKIRTVDISKGNTRFCTCQFIEREVNKLFYDLANANYFIHYTRDELVKAIAEFYAEINVVHPFREGNGRAQRILFEHIITNTGFTLSLASIEQNEWIEANIAGYNGDYGPMEALFEHCISIERLLP